MEANRFDALSSREQECLTLLATPMRPKEIAAQLGLSPKTVEAHLASAKRKIGAQTPLHAARLLSTHFKRSEEKFLEEIPRVEPPGPAEPNDAGSAGRSSASEGRTIKLDWRLRTVIVLVLTFAAVLAVLMIVAGADAIARLAASYYHSGSPVQKSKPGSRVLP